jgi:hypothetical protein
MPPYGLGANPVSCVTTYENNRDGIGVDTERQVSGAAGSRSEVRAEAIGSRLQTLVRRSGSPCDSSVELVPLFAEKPSERGELPVHHAPVKV